MELTIDGDAKPYSCWMCTRSHSQGLLGDLFDHRRHVILNHRVDAGRGDRKDGAFDATLIQLFHEAFGASGDSATNLPGRYVQDFHAGPFFRRGLGDADQCLRRRGDGRRSVQGSLGGMGAVSAHVAAARISVVETPLMATVTRTMPP